MLIQIRDFIQQEKTVSLQRIARHFAIESLAVRPMVDFWIRRGVIAVCDSNNACQTACFKCPASTHIYYKYCANIKK